MAYRMVFASNNVGKIEQVRSLFALSRFTLESQAEAGVLGEGEERRDPSATLADNARIKARYVFEQLQQKKPVFADDSGVFIRALGGKPGVQTRYWGGEHVSIGECVRYTLERLQNATDRNAIFRSVIVLVYPDGSEEVFQGDVNGSITGGPRGPVTKGLPFNQLFQPFGTHKTFAQMDQTELSAFSHRGRAFTNMLRALEQAA